MRVFTTIKQVQRFLRKAREQRNSIGLVPTMGALHEGHLALVEKSLKENHVTVCSVFVNPIQFNNAQDLKAYPRSLRSDLSKLRKWGCQVVFAPSEIEMYPEKERISSISFGEVEKILEGEFRPGHFAGVATVVSKLFNIVNPDKAYFGLKDLQQCFVIDQLVKEFSFPVKLRFIKTVREKSGLAVSSRNKRLTFEEREAAISIYKALKTAGKIMIESGSIARGRTAAKKIIEDNNLLNLEYFEVINPESFKKISRITKEKEIAICTAVYAGNVRLIDNLMVKLS